MPEVGRNERKGLKRFSSAARLIDWRVVLLLAITRVLPSCSRISPTGPLLVTPAALELGAVSVGVPITSRVTVRNASGAPFVIEWNSSCDCVTIEPTITTILPGDSQQLRVKVDLDEELTGKLGVLITGITPDAKEALTFTVSFGPKALTQSLGAEDVAAAHAR